MVVFLLIFVLLFHAGRALDSVTIDAYPSGLEPQLCRVEGSPMKSQRKIIDITHSYREDMPIWDSDEGLGTPVRLVESIAEGSEVNLSELKLRTVHMGTHVDAPGHAVQEAYELGLDVASLDLNVLNGPVLLVDAPRDSNLTAEVMEALRIPLGVERIIFKTLNTDRQLMWKREFDTSYVGLTLDGADWLVHHTEIRLIGLDYLSVTSYDDLAATHRVL